MSQGQEGKLIKPSCKVPRRHFSLQPVVKVKKFSLEVQVLECEVRLHDACGFDSGPQDILLSWDVSSLGYPVQIVQVAETKEARRENKNSREKREKEKTAREEIKGGKMCQM